MIELFFNIALAIDSLCFSPPDNLTPFSPIKVSYLFGSLLINSSQNESFATRGPPHLLHVHLRI